MSLGLLQQLMIGYLKKNIVKEHILEARCPFDNGKHNCTNSADTYVGNLHRLPIEIQQHILSFLDIKSLLAFRRISKPAMSLVNSNLDYHKVVTNAPMALRMAIAIGTHDRYTIADLFAALCQRTCAECGTLAHYVCLFTCQRVCLSLNGFCRGELGPWQLVRQDGDKWLGYADEDGDIGLLVTDNESPLTFTPVPGLYQFARPAGDPSMARSRRVSRGDIFVHWQGHSDEEWNNLCDVKKGYIGVQLTLNKSLSVVVAPWLSKTSLDGVYGTRCLICKAEDEKRDKNPATGATNWKDYINLRQCEIWTEEGLANHMREAHGLAKGDYDH